jgi:hypothetical protein
MPYIYEDNRERFTSVYTKFANMSKKAVIDMFVIDAIKMDLYHKAQNKKRDEIIR